MNDQESDKMIALMGKLARKWAKQEGASASPEKSFEAGFREGAIFVLESTKKEIVEEVEELQAVMREAAKEVPPEPPRDGRWPNYPV